VNSGGDAEYRLDSTLIRSPRRTPARSTDGLDTVLLASLRHDLRTRLTVIAARRLVEPMLQEHQVDLAADFESPVRLDMHAMSYAA
jgi:hypothetical protein